MDLTQFIQPEFVKSDTNNKTTKKKRNKATKRLVESADSLYSAKVFVVGRADHPKLLITKCFPHQQKVPQFGYKIDVCIQ